jgi:hypothetical protein
MAEEVPEEVPVGLPRERNTRGTYLKALVLTLFIGSPLSSLLLPVLSLAGLLPSFAFALWLAGKATGLRGAAAYVVVYLASLVGLVAIGSAILWYAFSMG